MGRPHLNRTDAEKKFLKQVYQNNYRKTRPLKYLYNLAKGRSKERGIDFSLDVSDLVWNDYCPLLGLCLNQHDPDMDYHASLDRIDSTKGYVKGNVMIISYRANRIKSNAVAEELLILGRNLKKYEVST